MCGGAQRTRAQSQDSLHLGLTAFGGNESMHNSWALLPFLSSRGQELVSCSMRVLYHGPFNAIFFHLFTRLICVVFRY